MTAYSNSVRTTDTQFQPIPVAKVAPWAIFGGLMLLLALYFVGAEEGAASMVSGNQVHEFVHDGRHMLAFPCH